jgi:hypothetical protein
MVLYIHESVEMHGTNYETRGHMLQCANSPISMAKHVSVLALFLRPILKRLGGQLRIRHVRQRRARDGVCAAIAESLQRQRAHLATVLDHIVRVLHAQAVERVIVLQRDRIIRHADIVAARHGVLLVGADGIPAVCFGLIPLLKGLPPLLFANDANRTFLVGQRLGRGRSVVALLFGLAGRVGVEPIGICRPIQPGGLETKKKEENRQRIRGKIKTENRRQENKIFDLDVGIPGMYPAALVSVMKGLSITSGWWRT